MKSAAPLLLPLTLSALVAACGSDDQGTTGEPAVTVLKTTLPIPNQPIAPKDLVDRIKAGSAPTILDVRTDAEFKAGHVPGAVHIPYDELASRLDELTIKKSDEVVVYCKIGGRAGRAEKTLADAGYTNVRDLTGHWTAWAAGKYTAEKTK